jgi:hypothetical protein
VSVPLTADEELTIETMKVLRDFMASDDARVVRDAPTGSTRGT